MSGKRNNQMSKKASKAGPSVSKAKPQPKKNKNKGPKSGPKQIFSSAGSIHGGRVPRFSSVDNGATLMVSGSEVFSEVSCTSHYLSKSWFINPSEFLLFPKLQALALIFEKFSIRDLVVRYLPGCPTTRSGSIGMMFDYDSADYPPADILELMNNSSSVVFPVGSPATLKFLPKSSNLLWYYTKETQPSSDADRFIYPASFFLISDKASSDDNESFAGYLDISYTICFKDMKPINPTVVSRASGTTEVVPNSGLNPSGWVDWSTINQALGYFGGNNPNNGPVTGYGPLDGKTSQTITDNNSLLLEVGAYLFNYAFNVGAPGTTLQFKVLREPLKDDHFEMLDFKELKSLDPPKLTRQIALSSPSLSKARSAVRDTPPLYSEIWQDPKTLLFWGLLTGTLDDWVLILPNPPGSRKTPLTPASGDFTYDLDLVSENGTFTTIDTFTWTALGSAITHSSVLPITVSSPVYALLGYYMDYPSDTRSLISAEFGAVSIPITQD